MNPGPAVFYGIRLNLKLTTSSGLSASFWSLPYFFEEHTFIDPDMMTGLSGAQGVKQQA